MDAHPTTHDAHAIARPGIGTISIGAATLDVHATIDRFGGRVAIAATSRLDTPFVAQGCRYDITVFLDARALVAGRLETTGELSAVAVRGDVDLIRSHPVEAPYDADSRGRSRLAKIVAAAAAAESIVPPIVRERVERSVQDLTIGYLAEALDDVSDTSRDDRFSRSILDDVAYDRINSIERAAEFARQIGPWSPRGMAFACLRPDGRPLKLSVDPRGAEPLGPGAGILFPTIVGIVEAARRTSMNPTGVPNDGRGAPVAAAIRLILVDRTDLRLIEWTGERTRSVPFDASRPVLAGTPEID